MNVRYLGSKNETTDVFSFQFRPQKPVHYTAGQFTELYLPHDNEDSRGNKRWFTLSSSPHEENLTITTNFSRQTVSSFKKTLLNLEPGAEVAMALPMGDFVLPKDPNIPLIFIAGGIGCTPFRSIISELLLTNQNRDISMLYSVRDPKQVVFNNLFHEYLDKKFTIISTEVSNSTKKTNGKLNAAMIDRLIGVTDEHYIYISGPEPMVEMLWKDLIDNNFNKQHIYTDFFLNYFLADDM